MEWSQLGLLDGDGKKLWSKTGEGRGKNRNKAREKLAQHTAHGSALHSTSPAKTLPSLLEVKRCSKK